MKNKVYVLFQTDIWKTKSSRVCFGVFLYENAAIDAAKENGLYTNESEVDIIECELGKLENLRNYENDSKSLSERRAWQ